MNNWAWTAMALFAAWAVTAFGIRAVLQRRRTGDSGFRGISGRPASAAWWAGVLFTLSLLGGAAAPAAALAGMPTLPGAGDGTALRWTGLAAALAGMAATLLAQSGMGDSWRVGVDAAERTELVTSGLFAYVRNPVFTTMTVTAAGLALMVPNALAVLACLVLVLAIQLQVRVVEEPYLMRVHGPAYADYAARAGRFLPGVGRRACAAGA
ncbi:isoprenylcysteine carboxylmethyltransferase family protein [Streptomyces sp. A0592]|uniref:methyltransferase family protein n=1 Tax=Streptomyces sp. A0592 TaxID=2563099 RepID=UPI00109EDE90|nr:isoprenylcysteine carboxylmethyltransferase family protein [Streptomyces sp. A0592]THA81705.1 isoprenylcysteine carboxylmethyltransferase family protein [Streptomyces sp. A0592]